MGQDETILRHWYAGGRGAKDLRPPYSLPWGGQFIACIQTLDDPGWSINFLGGSFTLDNITCTGKTSGSLYYTYLLGRRMHNDIIYAYRATVMGRTHDPKGREHSIKFLENLFAKDKARFVSKTEQARKSIDILTRRELTYDDMLDCLL